MKQTEEIFNSGQLKLKESLRIKKLLQDKQLRSFYKSLKDNSWLL